MSMFVCQSAPAGRQQLRQTSVFQKLSLQVALRLLMLSFPNVSFEGDEGKRGGGGGGGRDGATT